MKKGFTLLEALIAIAIMTIAVGAAFSMAQKSLQTSYQIKDQTTAYFLAAEGLELVRNLRDSVANYNKSKTNISERIYWMVGGLVVDNCAGSCDANPFSDFKDPKSLSSADIKACPSLTGCKIYAVNSSGKSVYTSFPDNLPSSLIGGSRSESSFSRWINIDIVNAGSGKEEAVVTSTVTWSDQTISLTETLSNWQSI